MLLKNGRDPGEVRSDTAQQSALTLLESPLSQADVLQVSTHTQKKVLIEVSPQT